MGKDDKEGYLTLSGNQGTVYLETYSSYNAFTKQLEGALKELQDAVGATSKYIDQKSEELKSVRSGPLAKTKSELLEMKPKVKEVQYKYSDLKKRVSENRKKVDECMEVEKRRRQEVAEQKAAESMKTE